MPQLPRKIPSAIGHPFWNAAFSTLGKAIPRRPKPGRPLERAMVYSPNVGGHRPLYSKKLVDALRNLGVQEIYFVYAGLQKGAGGAFVPLESPHLKAMDQAGVHMVDVADRFKSGIGELAFITGLQREHDIDYTLFVDGDALIGAFTRQLVPGAPKLIGRNCAVFILSEFFHRGSLSWRQARHPKRREELKHKYFHVYLLRHMDLLDGALFSDECFVRAAKSGKFLHLPEVGHARIPPDHDERKNRFFDEIERRYLEFLGRNKGKDVILAFGDLEMRKGFDYLLRLVKENPDLVLARIGRVKPSYRKTWEETLDLEQLAVEDRFFEVSHYINGQQLIDTLFNSVNYLLLPYKNHFRTSSVMIQALSYARPVLVPHVGLPRYRVERNRLGRFFRHLDYEDFAEEYAKLRKDHASYGDGIREYYEREFSDHVFENTLAKTLDQKDEG